MNKTLPCLVAQVVGDKNEYQHADDVGHKGNRHHQNGQHDIAQLAGVSHQIGIQKAQCLERENGIQPSAGISHQQLVLPNRQDDAGAAHGVTGVMHQHLGGVRHRGFQRNGQCLHQHPGERHQEQEKEERKCPHAQGLRATQKQHQGQGDTQNADHLALDDLL